MAGVARALARSTLYVPATSLEYVCGDTPLHHGSGITVLCERNADKRFIYIEPQICSQKGDKQDIHTPVGEVVQTEKS